MPARPPVANTALMRLSYTMGDKIAENILHWVYTPAGNAPLTFIEALAAAGNTAAGTFEAVMGTTTQYQSCTVTDLNSDIGFTVESGTPITGTRDGDPLPANVALLASYAMARRYRGGHPRTYLPWFTATDVDTPQTWVAESLAEASPVWAAALDSIASTTGGGYSVSTQAQVSYVTAGAPRVTPITDAILFTVLDLNIASQRRRDGRH